MSRELHTPMNAILGYSQLLQEEAEEKGAEDLIPDLQKIHSSGAHLLGLINNILDLAKVESGRMELNLETIELAKLVQKIDSVILPLAEQNGNIFKVHVARNLGFTATDSTKLLQILINLLGNACKFTKNGNISLDIDRTTENSQEWFIFKIVDTGVGMSPEQCSLVSEKFVQTGSSTTRKHEGTGLGLAISKLFCRMMGGDMTVESELGKGSTFTVRLPKKTEG
jgi:signal transduction histidine kinase